ncbi:hypothetical protein [Streptomyces tailanensis]|uniref:hypothetical protein n=1 Tax=Streptomyces tailanensis TaxID=2569858 RepID=UPI001C0EDA55|nr:hypothetical protein [Streptomyces tailanensis]
MVGLSPTRPSRDETWRDAPVARTLGGAELAERTGQWRGPADKAERHVEIPDGVRLVFPASAEPAGEVAALAFAEQGCCAFFGCAPAVIPFAVP